MRKMAVVSVTQDIRNAEIRKFDEKRQRVRFHQRHLRIQEQYLESCQKNS